MKLELQRAGGKVDGRWLVRAASIERRQVSKTARVGTHGSGKMTMKGVDF